MMSPPPCAQHVRHRRRAGVERAEQVDVDDPAVFVDVALLDAAGLHDARRIDQDVDAAELGDGILDRLDRIGLDRHVAGQRQRLAAGRLDLRGQPVEPVRAAGGYGDGRARRGQGNRRRRADPGTAPVTSATLPSSGLDI